MKIAVLIFFMCLPLSGMQEFIEGAFPFMYTDGTQEYTIWFSQEELNQLPTLKDLKDDFQGQEIPPNGMPISRTALISKQSMDVLKQALELNQPTFATYTNFIKTKVIAEDMDAQRVESVLTNLEKLALYLDFTPFAQAIGRFKLSLADGKERLEGQSSPKKARKNEDKLKLVINGSMQVEIGYALVNQSSMLKNLLQDTEEEGGEIIYLSQLADLIITPESMLFLNKLASMMPEGGSMHELFADDQRMQQLEPFDLEVLISAANIAAFLGAPTVVESALKLILNYLKVDFSKEREQQDPALFFAVLDKLKQELKQSVYEALLDSMLSEQQKFGWKLQEMMLNSRPIEAFTEIPRLFVSPESQRYADISELLRYFNDALYAVSADGKYLLVGNQVFDGRRLAEGVITKVCELPTRGPIAVAVGIHPSNSAIMVVSGYMPAILNSEIGRHPFIQMFNIEDTEHIIKQEKSFKEGEKKHATGRIKKISFVPTNNHLALKYNDNDIIKWRFWDFDEKELDFKYLSSIGSGSPNRYQVFNAEGTFMGGVQKYGWVVFTNLRNNASYWAHFPPAMEFPHFNILGKGKVTKYGFPDTLFVDTVFINEQRDLIGCALTNQVRIIKADGFFSLREREFKTDAIARIVRKMDGKAIPNGEVNLSDFVASWEVDQYVTKLVFSFDKKYILVAGNVLNEEREFSVLEAWGIENISHKVPNLVARIKMDDFYIVNCELSKDNDYLLIGGINTKTKKFLLALHTLLPLSPEERIFSWVLSKYAENGTPISLFESTPLQLSLRERLLGWFISSSQEEALQPIPAIETKALENFLLNASPAAQSVALKFVGNPRQLRQALDSDASRQ